MIRFSWLMAPRPTNPQNAACPPPLANWFRTGYFLLHSSTNVCEGKQPDFGALALTSCLRLKIPPKMAATSFPRFLVLLIPLLSPFVEFHNKTKACNSCQFSVTEQDPSWLAVPGGHPIFRAEPPHSTQLLVPKTLLVFATSVNSMCPAGWDFGWSGNLRLELRFWGMRQIVPGAGFKSATAALTRDEWISLRRGVMRAEGLNPRDLGSGVASLQRGGSRERNNVSVPP